MRLERRASTSSLFLTASSADERMAPAPHHADSAARCPPATSAIAIPTISTVTAPMTLCHRNDTSGAPKLAPGEERIVPVGVPGGKTAVINLTITETEGNGGYVATFPANATWPGNSSINWFGVNQNQANTTLCATDASGQIRIRGGSAATHVIVDVIGYLN